MYRTGQAIKKAELVEGGAQGGPRTSKGQCALSMAPVLVGPEFLSGEKAIGYSRA
jgi:hypothetical protein